MPVIRALAFALLLTGCAPMPTRDVPWFEAASRAELHAEREQCYSSGFCRALIDDRPPVLFLALTDEPNCAAHAGNAELVLRAYGIETRPATAGAHEWLEARVDGKWWAVDNGALPWCDRVCTADEARHGVKHGHE